MNGAGVLAVATNQDQSGGQFLLLQPVIMRGGLACGHRVSPTVSFVSWQWHPEQRESWSGRQLLCFWQSHASISRGSYQKYIIQITEETQCHWWLINTKACSHMTYCIWNCARWLPFLLELSYFFLIHFIHFVSEVQDDNAVICDPNIKHNYIKHNFYLLWTSFCIN